MSGGAVSAGGPAAGKLEISVTEPVKHNEAGGLAPSSYIAYKVNTSTDRPEYRLGQTSVIRRYSDFLWLHTKLVAAFPGAIIPPLPEKGLVGRFEASFVETRRRALERFLRRVAAHPELVTSADLVTFLQADEGALHQAREELKRQQLLPPPKKVLAMFKSAINQVSQSSSIEVPRNSNDAVLDEVGTYVAVVEVQFAALHREASALVRREKEVADSLFQLGLAMTLLGQNEVAGLGEALRCTGHAIDGLSVVAGKGVEDAQVHFEEPIADWHRTVVAVKAALHKRVETRKAYQEAMLEVRRLTVAKDKLVGLIGKEDKLAAAEAALARGQQVQEDARQQYEAVGRRFLRDFERFKQDKAEDLKAVQLAHIRLRVAHHDKMAGGWRELLPKIERVNVSDTRIVTAAGRDDNHNSAGNKAGGASAGANNSNNKQEQEEESTLMGL